MGLGTAGAVFDAISRARETERQTTGSSVARLHMSRAERNRYYKAIADIQAKYADQMFEEFACYHLCSRCGYLGNGEGDCPACCLCSWIDLRDSITAQNLRDVEESERMETPLRIKMVALVISCLSSFLFFGSLILFGNWGKWGRTVDVDMIFYTGVAVVVAIMCGYFLYLLLHHPLSALLLRTQDIAPMRWLAPVPSPIITSGKKETLRGPCQAQAGQELLTAPLSGRRCLAYRIALLFDVSGDTRPPIWALDECHAVDLMIGKHLLRGNSVGLELILKPLPEEQLNISDHDLALFLRKRGLFFEGGGLQFFEAILVPHDFARVVFYQKPTGSGPLLFKENATISRLRNRLHLEKGNGQK